MIIYLNDATSDNSMEVIQPFVDAGYATMYNSTGIGFIYNKCRIVVNDKVDMILSVIVLAY